MLLERKNAKPKIQYFLFHIQNTKAQSKRRRRLRSLEKGEQDAGFTMNEQTLGLKLLNSSELGGGKHEPDQIRVKKKMPPTNPKQNPQDAREIQGAGEAWSITSSFFSLDSGLKTFLTAPNHLPFFPMAPLHAPRNSHPGTWRGANKSRTKPPIWRRRVSNHAQLYRKKKRPNLRAEAKGKKAGG